MKSRDAGHWNRPHLCFALFTQTCIWQAFENCFLQADQRLKGGGAFEPQIRWVFFNSLLENRKYTDHQLQNVAYDPANV